MLRQQTALSQQKRWLGVVCWLALSCSAPGQKLRPRPSLLDSSRPLEQTLSPPEWRYHPRRPAQLTRSYELAQGAHLFVGGAGERWLIPANAASAQPASALAPEALVGMLSARHEPWIFVGESGSTYEAAAPLGPFVSSSAPPERLARVSAGDHHLLGVNQTGRLLLSDDAGSTWHAVGPGQERFSDVLVLSPYALALAVPERVWWSSNEGRSWAALDAAPFGAERFDRDEEAGAVIRAALGARSVQLTGNAPPQLKPLGRNVRPDEPSLSAAPAEGPNARAIASGRAFLSDGDYFELELGVRAETLSGKLGGALTRRKAPLLSPCQEGAVAGFHSSVYVACTRERSGTARSFEFFRSDDGGVSFEREPYTARGNPELVRLAAGADGALLVTGFCPAQDDLAGCHARGIQLRRELARDAGSAVGLEQVAAPALDDNALALTFAADGHAAYAVGQRTKSDALFMFTAREPSLGFVARELSRLDPAGSSAQRQVRSLTAARDGQLALVTSQGSGADQLVVLDSSGRMSSINPAPLELATLGAYGAWALAVGPDEVWESLDGGAHWEAIGRLPRALCPPTRSRCSPPIFCQQEGCALGDSLTRLGWRAEQRALAPVLPPTPPRERATRRALAKPFGCELSDAEWTELAGVDRLPDASQAALGNAAWFALSADDATAAAGLWIADAARSRPEGTPRVRHSDLLRPSERPAEHAYYATSQVEGAAALRYAVPGSPGAASTHVANVEVAWENLFEGRRGRAVIVDAGPQLPGDFVKTTGPARRAQVDLLSIASGGIFARLHRQPEHNQVTYYLDGSTVEELPPLTADLLLSKGIGREMLRIGANNLALLRLNDGATVVRAKHERDRWAFDAMSVGFLDGERFVQQSHDLTYIGGRAASHVTIRFASGVSEARLFPLQAEGNVFGASLPVPTQAQLADGSFGCTQPQRQSPRLLAPRLAGTRHPVLVHDPVEPLRVFLTDTAVLHGTLDAACAQAFEAEPVRTPLSVPGARERVLLSAEGPSWLFRMAPDNARRDLRIEYRTMKCSFDGGLEVPPEVNELPDTRIDG
ncbi:MAG: hypothetical protein RL685_2528 [Pseudomonadota bacterium]